MSFVPLVASLCLFGGGRFAESPIEGISVSFGLEHTTVLPGEPLVLIVHLRVATTASAKLYFSTGEDAWDSVSYSSKALSNIPPRPCPALPPSEIDGHMFGGVVASMHGSRDIHFVLPLSSKQLQGEQWVNLAAKIPYALAPDEWPPSHLAEARATLHFSCSETLSKPLRDVALAEISGKSSNSLDYVEGALYLLQIPFEIARPAWDVYFASALPLPLMVFQCSRLMLQTGSDDCRKFVASVARSRAKSNPNLSKALQASSAPTGTTTSRIPVRSTRRRVQLGRRSRVGRYLFARYRRINAFVELSCFKSGAVDSSISGMIFTARTFPSSTPHWSNESIFQMTPCVNTACSYIATSFP